MDCGATSSTETTPPASEQSRALETIYRNDDGTTVMCLGDVFVRARDARGFFVEFCTLEALAAGEGSWEGSIYRVELVRDGDTHRVVRFEHSVGSDAVRVCPDSSEDTRDDASASSGEDAHGRQDHRPLSGPSRPDDGVGLERAPEGPAFSSTASDASGPDEVEREFAGDLERVPGDSEYDFGMSRVDGLSTAVLWFSDARTQKMVHHIVFPLCDDGVCQYCTTDADGEMHCSGIEYLRLCLVH